MHNPGNLLGAIAVVVNDAVEVAIGDVLGHAGETGAALVALGHVPGLTNQALCQVLGLSHPGAVRLVDRLVAAGLVERRPASDRRAVALHLTVAGERRRRVLLDGRRIALDRLLTPLDARMRAQLGELLATILRTVPRDKLEALSVCRLCDHSECQDCPIDAALLALKAEGHGT